jgi:hypothetical protein
MAMPHVISRMIQQVDSLSTQGKRIYLVPVIYLQHKEERRLPTPPPISSGIAVCKRLLLGTRAALTYKWFAGWHAISLRPMHEITPRIYWISSPRQGSAGEVQTAESARRGWHAAV